MKNKEGVYNLFVGLVSSQAAKDVNLQADATHPVSSIDVLTFLPDEDIDYAFFRLSAGIKTMIENCKFDILQGACIEKALSPKTYISYEIVPKIEAESSFPSLCTTLTKSHYWNFLDTRMMEAMVTASMIPAAQETLKNFKKTFFGMKLSEVVPFIPVILLNPNHTVVAEELDVDPSQYTISDLHKHRFYLESEFFQSGNGTLTCYKIMMGSLFILWQIHVDHAYSAYLMLRKKISHFQSLAIRHLSVPAIEKWAKLPVVLRGQEVKQIGPIEQPLKDRAREDPYPLQKGFEWTWLNSVDIVEMYKLQHKHRWLILHPRFAHNYVVSLSSHEAKSTLRSSPNFVNIRGCVFSVACAEFRPSSSQYDDRISLMFSEMLKELLKKTELIGTSQALISTNFPIIIKPVVVLNTWVYCFTYPQSQFFPALPYDSPKTSGLRRITPKDIYETLNLVNCYASKFEISQIFKSEEEFSHHFLSPLLLDNTITYIVEDPISHSITDMFAFSLQQDSYGKSAVVTAVVVTKSPARQLVTDLLLYARLEKVDRVCTTQHGLTKSTFENLFRDGFWKKYISMYNFGHPEIDEEKCGVLAL